MNVTILLLEAEKPGVQLNVLPDNEEPVGLPDTEYVSASPSRSDPESVSDRVEPSATVWLSMLPKVGACLRALGEVGFSHIIDGRKSHSVRDALSGAAIGTRVG